MSCNLLCATAHSSHVQSYFTLPDYEHVNYGLASTISAGLLTRLTQIRTYSACKSEQFHDVLKLLLQDCIVYVGGRLSIPPFEPELMHSGDVMSAAVEILWWKPPPVRGAPSGQYLAKPRV